MTESAVRVESIPECLKAYPQWVVWRYEMRAGKRTKVPIQAKLGWNASVAQPSTWCSFEDALAAYKGGKRYEGLGFVFSPDDPFCGIDIDDCLDDAGNLLWGDDLLETLASYCEISPSGRGLKLILQGTKPGFARCKADWFGRGTIEVYDRNRVFAITGRRFGGTPEGVMERQRELDALCGKLWPVLREMKPPIAEANPNLVDDSIPTETSGAALQRCLTDMLRMQVLDRGDGSHRLYCACCRAVEHGLSDSQALACLREYERRRPFPQPWSDPEILKRLRDAEQVCQRGSAGRTSPRLSPVSYGNLSREFPTLHGPVIEGLLREGETLTVIASPKTGKSWLATDLAVTLATGRPLFDLFPTEPGRVLVIDNELHPPTIRERIDKVCAARGVSPPEVSGILWIQSLRGRLVDLFGMADYFGQFPRGQFQVVILDALYRMLPAGMDENNNAHMASVFNQIDVYAEQLGASFVCVHHSSKGSQAGKSVTDVGAGAGAMARATDSHLILRPHEEAACVVLEAAVRSWPPIEPRVLRWTFPVWTPEDALDPAALRGERPHERHRRSQESSRGDPEWTVERFVKTFVSEIAQSAPDICDAAEEAGLSPRRIQKLLRRAVRESLIFKTAPGGNRPVEYATSPISGPATKTESIRELLLAEPDISNRRAAQRTMASHALVNKVRKQLEGGGNRVRTQVETV